ncbi:8-hydroxygeraniol oxidoreductase-like [Apium graveolens]|uniref:8-hydroxygeraniol oxidoreductase-like n=1 Tax=Apium graveolens TaxID=4045 RepID=UPI003D7A46C5
MSNCSLQVITCKAVVIWKAGETVKVEEIKVDPPKTGEVRIKMLFASVCHTDILYRHGFLPKFPRALGHEGVGMVEAVGENVNNVEIGDIVMPFYLGECGDCLNCNSGKSNLCHVYPLNLSGLLPDGTSRMSIASTGEKLYHHFCCSTWSEYTVLDSHYMVKVDPKLPLPHASFLSCGFTTGFGSAWRTANVDKASTVAVLGLGAVGLGAIEGARMQGASKIIGVDLIDFKGKKGTAFGMTDFINPKESGKSISELVKEATGGLGVDYCFECTGVPSLLSEAIESTKVGLGTIVLIGTGTDPVGHFNIVPFLCGRTLKGTILGGVKTHSDLPTIINKSVNKEIKLEELLTHEFALDEINEALETTKHPECVKILIKF